MGEDASQWGPRRPIGGWAAYGLALLTGVLYFVAFPGIDVWPLSLVALVPLIIALRGQTTKRCTGLGWMAGMGMTMCGFYWLREMLTAFSQMPEPLPTLFMTLLCAYQSGRIALCGFLYGRAVNRGWNAPLVFAGAFAVSELTFPLLFPWFYGATVHNALPLLQTADIGGPILVGLTLVAPNLAIAHLVESLWRRQKPSRVLLAVGIAVPVVAAGYGFLRLSQIRSQDAAAEVVKIALVQGNQPLIERGKAREVHLALTAKAKEQGAQLVVWSEGAVDVFYEKGHAEQIRKRVTGNLGVPTVVGTMLVRTNPPGSPKPLTAFNTALMADDAGVIGSRYDKTYLLMFGEYMPLGKYIPALYQLSPNSSEFLRGESLEPLMFGERRLSTTICYEDILPGFVNDMARHAKPDLLVNLTNDGWFGNTTEPWIHLALAKLRSVEHRRYLARATNSGISAIVDATGGVVVHGGAFTEEMIIGDAKYMSGGTVYQLLGDKPWWLLAAVMLLLSVLKNPWWQRSAAPPAAPPPATSAATPAAAPPAESPAASESPAATETPPKEGEPHFPVEPSDEP